MDVVTENMSGAAKVRRGGVRPARAVGRVVLWAFLLVVLVRGMSAILAGPDGVGSPLARPVNAAQFPNDEARAFAVRFARVYLTDAGRALRSYVTNDLSDDAADFVSRRGPGAHVAWAMVAREASLGSSRALVTVALVLADGRSRYLTVPVGRDRRGGLAVFDLPAVSPPPPLGDVGGDSRAPLAGSDAGPIADVVRRFIRAYLTGGSARDLAYYVAPGARITQMPAGLKVTAVDGLDQVGSDDGRLRVVVASIRVRDALTRAEYPLRYRLRLVRRDRWYVADVEGGPRA